MFSNRLATCCWFILCFLVPVQKCLAHPMGNFSVNHYSKISLASDGIRVSYIIDLAEIPTYQELQQGNITANIADATQFVSARGREFARGLNLTIDGKPVGLRLLSTTVIFPPGAGGLPTMKMGFVYEAAYPAAASGSPGNLEFVDNNYPGHAGWKEIVVHAPEGQLSKSSVSQTDRSTALSNYPTDMLNSPPQDLSATIEFRYPMATMVAVKAMPVPTAHAAHPAAVRVAANLDAQPRARLSLAS